ncbi:MAG: hypothetical protein KC621_26205 [Myxococcales bacterium]|nr:hypothetical protein [Myxococcales bacterium]
MDPSITLDQVCDEKFGTRSSCTFLEAAALQVKQDGTFSDHWGAYACWDGLGHQVSQKLGYSWFVYPDYGESWTWTFAPNDGILINREYRYFSNGIDETCCEGQHEDVVVVGDASAIDCPVVTHYEATDFQ